MAQNERNLKGAWKGWNLSWESLLKNSQGEWWLMAQLLLILGLLLLPSWPHQASWESSTGTWSRAALGGGLLISGLVMALQSLLSLGASLSPLPEPKQGATLITTGAYQRCRHPLYQALLLSAAGVVILRWSPLHLLLLVLLAAVLAGKARREERSLIALHPDYGTYRRHTAAIVNGLPGLDWRDP